MARIRVNECHIGWADIIFVMEKKHGKILRESFSEALEGMKIVTLHVPDTYRCMEPALTDDLKAALSGHVEAPEQSLSGQSPLPLLGFASISGPHIWQKH